MNYQSEKVIVDDEFIDLMIGRCFSVDQYLEVRDRGGRWARLEYRKYTYQNHEGVFQAKKDLLTLTSIFKRLINRHNSFEHEGYKYYRHLGEWTRMKA